ncbi:hypothetical protein [Paraburkholderia unamae]|uniref:Uncharacterized protein n=1 Tax=Paraburkholderia unamae TaxID=219649 RepID=A0ACC6RH01_9BURK
MSDVKWVEDRCHKLWDLHINGENVAWVVDYSGDGHWPRGFYSTQPDPRVMYTTLEEAQAVTIAAARLGK